MCLLEGKVVNQERVAALIELKVGTANGQVVERLAKVPSRNNQVFHASEDLALVEEGVDEGIVFGAVLLESWVLAFQREVHSLLGRNIDFDKQLLDILSNIEQLRLLEISIKRDSGRPEIGLVHK